MTLDVQAQRLDPDRARRAALAAAPAAVAARHEDIATAWAPDKVPAIEAAYDSLVHANALSPAPSVTESEFVVTTWGRVAIDGTTATVMLTGHYRLTEPTNRALPNGVVDQPDQAWTITVRLVDDRWRLEDRTAT